MSGEVRQLPSILRPIHEQHDAPQRLRLFLRMLAEDLVSGVHPGPEDLAESAQRLHQARGPREANRQERRFTRHLLVYLLMHDMVQDSWWPKRSRRPGAV